MPISKIIDLKQAQELYDEGKLDKALQAVEKIEREKAIPTEEQLELLILKGKVYSALGYPEEAKKITEEAYQKSQTLGSKLHIFDALVARIWILLNYIKWTVHQFGSLIEENTVLQLTEQLENTFTNFKGIPLKELLEREADLMHLKGIIYYYLKKEFTKAIEHFNKALVIQEKLGNKSRIAEILMSFVRLYYFKGDLDESIAHSEQIIGNSDFPKIYKCKALGRLVYALRNKGELERAIKFNNQWQKFAKEINYKPCLAASFRMTSEMSRMKGDLDRALEFGKRSFEIAVFPQLKLTVLLTLIEISIEKENIEEANNYLNLSKQIVEMSNDEGLKREFQLSEAIVLKSSTNIRDRIKAEMILKDFIKLESLDVHSNEWALIQLCDLLLAELQRSNDMKLFDEINPIINLLSEHAIKQDSSWKLAETYLLKAKLSIIQMNMGEARKFLTQSQEIADNKGLGLLAQKISNEHDILLEQLSKWGNVQENKPPLSERIELSSFEGVIKRLLETRALAAPEIEVEEPVLLLIIAEGGVPLFSYPFTEDWGRDNELFGSFLSAITTFSKDFLSQGLDRVKFSQFTVIMEPMTHFSIYYVFKGQSYSAKQKLKHFTEKIQKSTPVWQTFEKFYQTSQVIEFKDFPFLEAFITEIFTGSATQF
ncbi:MAG: tetratricopeptide repeat protein [Promethearchaeota archaeon]|jgi:tetratricopeptide (TPR) repeat protein